MRFMKACVVEKEAGVPQFPNELDGMYTCHKASKLS